MYHDDYFVVRLDSNVLTQFTSLTIVPSACRRFELRFPVYQFSGYTAKESE